MVIFAGEPNGPVLPFLEKNFGEFVEQVFNEAECPSCHLTVITKALNEA